MMRIKVEENIKKLKDTKKLICRIIKQVFQLINKNKS